MNVFRVGSATLYQADFREVLELLPAVAHVITDPPYAEQAHTKQRRTLGKGISASRDIGSQALPFPPLSLEEREALLAYCAAQCAGWLIAFCQAESVGEWVAACTEQGLKWRRAGVWIKPDSSPQLSGDRPAVGHEAIAMAWCGKGQSRWNGGGARAVWTYSKHDPGQGHGGRPNEHPTQKPLMLMEKLIDQFTRPSELVCDFFMGSGSTGVACLNHDRPFIGIEREPGYFDIACTRLEAAYAQHRLFA